MGSIANIRELQRGDNSLTLGQHPIVVKGGKKFATSGKCGDLRRIFVSKRRSEQGNIGCDGIGPKADPSRYRRIQNRAERNAGRLDLFTERRQRDPQPGPRDLEVSVGPEEITELFPRTLAPDVKREIGKKRRDFLRAEAMDFPGGGFSRKAAQQVNRNERSHSEIVTQNGEKRGKAP